MSFPDRRSANVLLTILLFAAVLAVAYVARAVIVIFCFAILFAYLIDPIVRFLHPVTEPVLRPIRLRLPYSSLDFSPLVVILGIYVLQWFLVPVLVKTAYRLG